ncbi:hypothetical protein [Rhizobium leguminosarum]|uniref:hypothetical protein n=1 Tax=Rhizobium leguminosarum TaxID=384 RepID=UPI0013E3807D|nr:hypothetical protein [Rhizobium leguminosarum]
MKIHYIADFPIPETQLPPKLRTLLEPVGLDPEARVQVSTRFENDPHGPDREHVFMVMACMSEEEALKPGQSRVSGEGVVAYGTPGKSGKGSESDYAPSVDGSDYIVASWGSGYFYTYMLAEKVWMSLGLSMRLLGQDAQRAVFDDLSRPEYDVAEGEVSSRFHYVSSGNVHWRMSNDYLRQYLWMRGLHGVRLFYYQKLIADTPEVRAIMSGEKHVELGGPNSWYLLDIREHDGGLLMQVWAKVSAVSPQRCETTRADGLTWPGIKDPMTSTRANSIAMHHTVYMDDKFLEKYEQNVFYDTVPIKDGARWLCSPSYKGQWAFSNCVRIGRNLIQTSIGELYKPKPDREIVHAFRYAVPPEQLSNFDLTEEHIAAKVDRLVNQILLLGDKLSALGTAVGAPLDAADIVNFSREDLIANGWTNFPKLLQLAQVAPLDMSEQDFLARCKGIHELYQRIPDGTLRMLVQKAGHTREKIGAIKSMKLLQALTNILERLNADREKVDAFGTDPSPADLTTRNTSIAPLFVNAELRNVDAHGASGVSKALTAIGVDVVDLNGGYGRALDQVFDKVIGAFSHINSELEGLLAR